MIQIASLKYNWLHCEGQIVIGYILQRIICQTDLKPKNYSSWIFFHSSSSFIFRRPLGKPYKKKPHWNLKSSGQGGVSQIYRFKFPTLVVEAYLLHLCTFQSNVRFFTTFVKMGMKLMNLPIILVLVRIALVMSNLENIIWQLLCLLCIMQVFKNCNIKPWNWTCSTHV